MRLMNQENYTEYCSCGNILDFKEEFNHKHETNDDVYIHEILKIFLCPACNSITVIKYSASLPTSDREYGNLDPREWNEKVFNLDFNKKVLYSPPKLMHQAIPISIAEVLNQAKSVLIFSSRASFILCRAVLEEICNNFEVPKEKKTKSGKTTFVSSKERLSKLFEKESMNQDLKLIIEGIKDLGNEGAHSEHLAFDNQINSLDAEKLVKLYSRRLRY